MGERVVHCDDHGASRPTFVCGDLAASLVGGQRPLGFVTAGDTSEGEGRPNAWCAACDDVLVREGEWNERCEAFVQISLVCEHCWDRARTLNERA